MNRTAMMYKMRQDEKKTLREIAEIFGVSKQRIQQILGNTEHIREERIQQRDGDIRKCSLDMSDVEVSEFMDVSLDIVKRARKGLRRKIDGMGGSNLEIGEQAQSMMSVRLAEMGFDNELMPRHHAFSIRLFNGNRLNVKKATLVHPPSSPYPFFSVGAPNKDSDYLIVVGYFDGEEYVYVVPTEIAIRHSYMSRIRLCPFAGSSMSKRGHSRIFDEYINRFDLLSI